MLITILIVVVLAAILMGYFAFVGEGEEEAIETGTATAEVLSAIKEEPAETGIEESTDVISTEVEVTPDNVKEFSITAKRWSFDPEIITVNEGDNVVLHITSIDVAHGFVLSDFGVNERLNPGETVNVEFVADKVGTFRFFCNIFCGSGHNEMNGRLIVV